MTMQGDDEDLQGLEDVTEGGEEDNQPDYEAEAKALGWVPQDKFKGPKDKWVSAEDFVERGKNLMPVLLANNERLKGALLQRDREIGTLRQQVEGATAAIARLEAHYTDANKRSVEIAIGQLKEQLKEAREDQDVDKELELLDQIQEAQASLRKDKPSKDKKDDDQAKPKTEIQKWIDDNSDWYGVDKKKTKAFNRLAEDLREEGDLDHLNGRAYLEEVFKRLEGDDDEPATPPARKSSKVEGSQQRSGSGGVKGWSDLPADAKRACLEDEELFVGEGKKFKTKADWQKEFVRIYYTQ